MDMNEELPRPVPLHSEDVMLQQANEKLAVLGVRMCEAQLEAAMETARVEMIRAEIARLEARAEGLTDEENRLTEELDDLRKRQLEYAKEKVARQMAARMLPLKVGGARAGEDSDDDDDDSEKDSDSDNDSDFPATSTEPPEKKRCLRNDRSFVSEPSNDANVESEKEGRRAEKLKKLPLEDVHRLVEDVAERRRAGARGCPLCPDFNDRSNNHMMNHLIYHVADRQHYPCVCPFDECRFACAQEGDMRRHIEGPHKGNWSKIKPSAVKNENVERLAQWRSLLDGQ